MMGVQLVCLKEFARPDTYGTYKPGERFTDNIVHAKYLVDTGRAKFYEVSPKAIAEVKEEVKVAPKVKKAGRPRKK